MTQLKLKHKGSVVLVTMMALGLAGLGRSASTFFVTAPIQGSSPAAASAAPFAAAIMVRNNIPGELAKQLAGPDPVYPERVLFRPSSGAYLLADAGSQWSSAVGTAQTILAVAEVFAGKNGWNGAPFVGWSNGTVTKPDLVASLSTLPALNLFEVPAPLLLNADENQVTLQISSLGGTGASNYSLWRRLEGASTWSYLQSVSLPLSITTATILDSSVQSLELYRYGLSVELPWPGGGGAGARPTANGIFVSQARSESGLIAAAKIQPSPTPIPPIRTNLPTPGVGVDGWEIYPNPARGKDLSFIFEAKKSIKYNVFVYLLDGSLARESSGQAKEGTWHPATIGINGLASGLYLVRLVLKPEGSSEYSLPIKKLAIIH